MIKARSPRASVPFGMTIDNIGYVPAGYVADSEERIRGLSPLHYSGTGISPGTSLQYPPDNGLSPQDPSVILRLCHSHEAPQGLRPLDTSYKPLILKSG